MGTLVLCGNECEAGISRMQDKLRRWKWDSWANALKLLWIVVYKTFTH